MSFHILLDDVTTNVSGTAIYPQNYYKVEHGLIQVQIDSGTCTVAIQGRTSDDMDWFEIASYTADAAERISLFPQMRGVTTSISGATVRAELVETV